MEPIITTATDRGWRRRRDQVVARLRGARPASLMVAVLLAIVLVPFLVAMVAAGRSGWNPSSDQATEMLRTYDVGTGHTPLVGAYSRFGWNHPGPLLFWVAAPAYRLAGPPAVLVLMGAIQAASLVAAAAAARRLGGNALAGAVVVLAGVLSSHLDADHLVSFWNPRVAVMALVGFVFCAGAFAETGCRWALFVAIATGSWAVQAHLGSAPVVVTGAIAAAVWWWRARPPVRPARLTALAAAGFCLILWSGPLLQQFTAEEGNLSAIASFALDDTEAPKPLATTLGVAARELGFPAAWTGADEETILQTVLQSPPWTLALVPAGLVLGWVANRRGPSRIGRLACFALTLVAVSVVAITRTSGELLSYVLRWSWPIAMAASAVAVWTWWCAADRRLQAGPVGTAAGAAAIAITLVISVATTAKVLRGPIAQGSAVSRAVGAMVERIEARVPPGRYAVRWSEASRYGTTGTGIASSLARHGYDVDFPPELATAVGAFRAKGRTDLPRLMVISEASRASWSPPRGARLVAQWDPLTPSQRRRRQALETRIRADAGLEAAAPVNAQSYFQAIALTNAGARPDDLEGLAPLQSQGDEFEAWLTPAGA